MTEEEKLDALLMGLIRHHAEAIERLESIMIREWEEEAQERQRECSFTHALKFPESK